MNRLVQNILYSLLLVFLFSGCGEGSLFDSKEKVFPKQTAYFRIDLPQKEFKILDTLNNAFPFSAKVPVYCDFNAMHKGNRLNPKAWYISQDSIYLRIDKDLNERVLRSFEITLDTFKFQIYQNKFHHLDNEHINNEIKWAVEKKVVSRKQQSILKKCLGAEGLKDTVYYNNELDKFVSVEMLEPAMFMSGFSGLIESIQKSLNYSVLFSEYESIQRQIINTKKQNTESSALFLDSLLNEKELIDIKLQRIESILEIVSTMPVFDTTIQYNELDFVLSLDVVPSSYFVLDFGSLNSMVHCSFFSIDDNLEELFLLNEQQINKHLIVSSNLPGEDVNFTEGNKEGKIYLFKGDVATPIQFNLTNRTSSYLHGEFMFNCAPNEDSLAPVIDFIKTDIDTFMQSLQWK
jgi:hypothetical protein